eukprot:m.1025209 g.1025209  ORF g.1025209 m.1025209 type:complete len:90 (-) comp24103_c0_seq16:3427-3696(-)
MFHCCYLWDWSDGVHIWYELQYTTVMQSAFSADETASGMCVEKDHFEIVQIYFTSCLPQTRCGSVYINVLNPMEMHPQQLLWDCVSLQH